MQRNINMRSSFNNTGMYDMYQDNNDKNNGVKKETKIDFCELEEPNTGTTEYETLNEIDILIEQYFYFSNNLKRIRGRLYNLGIDPSKMNNLNKQ